MKHLMTTLTILAVLGALLASPLGASEKPFKAFLSGSAQVAPGSPCPAVKVTLSATGVASHFGKVQGEQFHCVNPNGMEPLGFGGGVFTLKGAEEDTVTGTYSGSLVATPSSETDNVMVLDGVFTITGGTGKFEGVKGGGVVTGLDDTVGGGAALYLNGTINFPEPAEGTNNAPVADAGTDQMTVLRETTLDGSKSSDPDSDTLTYSWKSVAKSAVIVNAKTAKPKVQFTEGFGAYVFELTVTDAHGESSKAKVTVFYYGR